MNYLRNLRKTHSRTGNKKNNKKMFFLRESRLKLLVKQNVIELDEVKNLDRIGRFTVAQTLFNKCSDDAKSYLLNDERT